MFKDGFWFTEFVDKKFSSIESKIKKTAEKTDENPIPTEPSFSQVMLSFNLIRDLVRSCVYITDCEATSFFLPVYSKFLNSYEYTHHLEDIVLFIDDGHFLNNLRTLPIFIEDFTNDKYLYMRPFPSH